MLLAVDTATATASIALYDLANGALLGENTWQARRRHTQDLLVSTQALMAQVSVQPAQLRALAVTTGPGSFTGVRIGLSVIKGIAIGLSATPQVVGLPTLTVTAAPWLALAQNAHASLWAYIQAGRGRYNWAIFNSTIFNSADFDSGVYAPTATDHRAGTAADFAAALADHSEQAVWLVGEAAPDLLEGISTLHHVTAVDSISAVRRAGVLAHLAAQQIAAGRVDDLATLQPLYLQGP